METTRKCKQCKINIVLETDDFLIYKDSYYHFNCFVESLTGKKRGAVCQAEAIKQAEELRSESKDKVKDIIAKNHLYKWLQRVYDIVVIPSYFFQKMDAIFDGTYKGMDRGVPAEDLLEIWQKKWNELNKTYDWNLSKGKKLDELGRLNYDLAIVLSKTSSYYKWKEQQRILQKEKEQELKGSGINFNIINKSVTNNLISENDISSLLEEI
jgi:hypothetical protein